jgi:cyclophilin family peptidyl-prolyl cis-trans isomerase
MEKNMTTKMLKSGRFGLPARDGNASAAKFDQLEQRCLLSNPPFQSGHTIVEMQTSNGNIMIELFDDTAPLTVQNFLTYVNENHYDGTFFHRLARSFALQGGHFEMGDEGFPVERDVHDPVVNEPGHTNSVRTLAMAKLGDDPNSATDQFFFNLNNNNDPLDPDNLDDQNGGFTVFGQVVNGWDTVLEISRLQITNAGNPFSELPVQDSYDFIEFLTEEDLVLINDVVIIASPGWSQQAVTGQVVNGAGSYTTSSMFVTTNSLGRPIAFYQDAGSDLWFVSDIGLETGAPALTGAVVQWHDTDELNFYAAAPSGQGLLVFKHNGDGMWEMRNITTELSGSLNIISEITVFESTDGYVHIAGLASGGPGGVGANAAKIVMYKQTGDLTAAHTWVFENIADNQLATIGQTTPQFVGALTSYVTTWNGLNIAGVDADGDIHTVWWAPGEATWRTDNLSELTGAPEYNGVITSFVAPWGGINLVGTDKNGKVTTTWWSPSDPWQTSNLTDLFSGPVLVGSTISSYVTPWGALNVAGTTSTNEVIIYWWAPDTQTWIVSSISDRVSQPVAPVTRLTGVSSDAGPISLVGTANNGHIIRYYWNPPTDTWAVQDLTDVARFL